MKTMVFDIETVPDVASGRRILNLEGLPDAEVDARDRAGRRCGLCGARGQEKARAGYGPGKQPARHRGEHRHLSLYARRSRRYSKPSSPSASTATGSPKPRPSISPHRWKIAFANCSPTYGKVP